MIGLKTHAKDLSSKFNKKRNYGEKIFHIWDLTGRYFSPNPNSDKVKQLCRRALMEQYDEFINLTGNRFQCLLTDESALAEINPGDIVEAELSFEVTDDFQQLVFAKRISINGYLLQL